MPDYSNTAEALRHINPETVVGRALERVIREWMEDSLEGTVVMTMERFDYALGHVLDGDDEEEDDEDERREEAAPTDHQPVGTFEVRLSATVFYDIRVPAASAAEAREQAHTAVQQGVWGPSNEPAINIKVIDARPVASEDE